MSHRKSRHHCPSAEPGEGNAEHPGGQSRTQIPRTPADPNTPASSNGQSKSHKPDRDWLDYVKFVVEVIGLGFLIVYTVYAGLQWRESKKAAKAAESAATTASNELELSDRPWLRVEADAKNGLMFVNGRQASFMLTLSIKNVGKSIAKGIQVDAKIVPTDPGMPLVTDAAQRQGQLCDHPMLTPIGAFDLFPSDNPTERQIDVSALPSEIAAQSVKATFPNGSSHDIVGFYVFGCVTYRSSFGNSYHQTRFSYHLISGPFQTANGKPFFAKRSDGNLLMDGFEVGINVPKDKLAMMPELFGKNEAY
jgi:hypothetical protein